MNKIRKKEKKRRIEGNHILCFKNVVDLKARNPRFLILCIGLDFQKIRGQKRPEPSIPHSMYSRMVIYIYMCILNSGLLCCLLQFQKKVLALLANTRQFHANQHYQIIRCCLQASWTLRNIVCTLETTSSTEAL